MSELPMLPLEQFERMKRYFPYPNGVPRVDDRRVISGIIYVIKNGLRWSDAPAGYGPHKTLYNRFVRWSKKGVFNKIFEALVKDGGTPERLMIDATHLKAHRTAASLQKKGDVPRAIGRTKGGLNSKLHAVVNGAGKPVLLHLSAGQVSDYKGAEVLLDKLPKTKEMLADRGYDADWFRGALIEKGIMPCIPPRKNRNHQYEYDKTLYKQRHKVENMFGRLKDWRRIAMRYDRCSHTFFSAICIAAINESISGVNPDKLWTILRGWLNKLVAQTKWCFEMNFLAFLLAAFSAFFFLIGHAQALEISGQGDVSFDSGIFAASPDADDNGAVWDLRRTGSGTDASMVYAAFVVARRMDEKICIELISCSQKTPLSRRQCL